MQKLEGITGAEPFSQRAALFFSVACLIVLYLGFAFNQNCLQAAMDGAIEIIQGRTQIADRLPFSQVGVSPLEGSFDAYYPLYHDYLLPSISARFLQGAFPDKLTTFFVLAVFSFLSALWLARTVGVARPEALLGSFLLPLFAFPGLVKSPSKFYILFSLSPFPAQIVGLSLLIVAALWALDGAGPRAKYALLLVPVTCMMLAILGFAGYLPLMLPATLLYGGASLLDGRRRLRDNVPRLVAMLVMIAVPAVLGSLGYLYGLFRYTAFNFFSDEFQQVRNNLLFASTFWTSSYGAWAIVLGLAGAAWTASASAGRLRLFAWTHLVVTTAFLVTAIVVVRFIPTYKGISPVYIETCFWPYTLIFAAVAIMRGARAIGNLVRGMSPGPAATWIATNSGATALALIIALVAVSNAAAARSGRPSNCRNFGFSSIEPSPITQILERNIAIKPGSAFNGMVATIDGVEGRPSVTWQELHTYDNEVWRAIGNEHRIPGLWSYSIPTLFQYGSFRSPPYYVVLTDFFTRASDRQERSGLVLSRIHAPMMRLLGVRYVITDGETDAGKIVAEIPVTGHTNLRLVELANVNLGNYSPTEVEHVADFRSGLAALHDPDFEGRRKVLADAGFSGSFVPAQLEALTYQKDGFQIRAKSAGLSVLVLPMQYSHCWTVEGEGAASLFRANLMQLGLRFRDKLDAKLVFRYGPIFAGACRIEDLRDMTRLHVAEARSDRQ